MSEDIEDENKQELAEERTEWAEERTEWADQRTFLAQQRTFASWLRTGLTSMAVGFGIIEFVQELEPEWLISAIGFLFILTGGVVIGLAFLSYRKVSMVMKRSSRPDMSISIFWAGLVSAGLIICAMAGLFFVFQ